MRRAHLVTVVQILLGTAVVIILAAQALFLPWLSGELARELPAEAYMRWPILGLSVAGLFFVQVALVCVVRLLGRVRRGMIFEAGSLPLIDGIIAAFVGGGLTCAATLAYQSVTVSGPPLFGLMLLGGIGAAIAMALLTWVGRSLLVDVIETAHCCGRPGCRGSHAPESEHSSVFGSP